MPAPHFRLRRILIAGALSAVGVGSLAWAAQSLQAPLVREGVTKRVSEHVYVIPDGDVPVVPNVGIVVGDRATLVVDTGLGVRNAEAVLREAAKVRRGDLYLVTTHFHPEHDLGAQAFPAGTVMIRSKDQQADIAEFGLEMAQRFSTFSPAIADLLRGAAFRPADVVFDQEHGLDLGGVRVRILAMGPNHTRGDTAVWVEPDAVLFSGDVAMKHQPALTSPYSSVRQWMASLDRFAALSPKVIVPSHGPVGGPEFIKGYHDYFLAVRERTAAAKRAGATEAEAVSRVSAELSGSYPDAGRLAGAIRAAYAEAG